MAILQSKGIMEVSSKPSHTPSGSQATLARLIDTTTFYVHVSLGNWATIDLNRPETFNGNIIGANASLGSALQSLSDAIEAIVLDGNHTSIARANATAGVAPTGVEVPDPLNGDTCDISLTNAKVEKWMYTGGSWVLSFTIDYMDVTNLSWAASPSSGVVSSDTGSNATITAVDATNAGLMLPVHKSKLDFITIGTSINLDTIQSVLATAIQTVASTNSILLSKSNTEITASLKLSATQGTDMSVVIESDGLSVVYDESKPTAYASREAATTALGVSKKFIYTKANYDGAVEGSVSWT